MNKKLTKLEWRGGIADSKPTDAVRVDVKSEGRDSAKPKGIGLKSSNPKGIEAATLDAQWSGQVKVRKETKGRAGKAVSLFFAFEPRISAPQGQELCSWLKENMACGGGVEDQEIVLQTTDKERLEKLLQKRKCRVIFAGGF